MSNYLSKTRREEIERRIAAGESLRQIARDVGVSKNSVMRYAAYIKRPALCRCGQICGHRGWCSYRYQKSLLRQFTLHPDKFLPIIDRLPELWQRMPVEYRNHAIRHTEDRIFREVSIKTKLMLLECGWAWVQQTLEEEKQQKNYSEEMKWLRESRKLMKQVKTFLKEHGS